MPTEENKEYSKKMKDVIETIQRVTNELRKKISELRRTVMELTAEIHELVQQMSNRHLEAITNEKKWMRIFQIQERTLWSKMLE